MKAPELDLEKELEKALTRHLPRDLPAPLVESTRYSLLAPGKRIRPRLLLACAEMLGLPQEASRPAALALEMVHCFTLIHDDLPCMDNDDFRRGRPSNHKQFGEATALLAGDGLMALAIDVFLEATSLRTQGFVNGLKRLAWAMGPRGVIGGQAAEPLLNKNSTIAEVRKMHAMKTGALFKASLLIPKDFAEIPDSDRRSITIDHFADELGLAFQALDDLDDAGKETGPTNILHYLSKEEVRDTALESLSRATDALVECWAEKATLLVKIADEVRRKLEAIS